MIHSDITLMIVNKQNVKSILTLIIAVTVLGIFAGCSRKVTEIKNSTHIKKIENPYYPYIKSLLYLRDGKINPAINKAIESERIKRSPEILIYISKLMFLKNKHAAANIVLYAHRKYPRNRKIIILLLNRTMPINTDKKITVAKKYLKNKNDNSIRIILADMYAQKQQISKSISTLSKITGKNNSKILISEGTIYLKLGLKGKAEKLFEKAYKLDSSNIKLGLFLAKLKEEKGAVAKAIKIYRKIAVRRPKDMFLRYHIANDLERIGKDKEALLYYNEVLNNGQRFKNRAAFSAGLIYLKFENFKKAEVLFEQLLKDDTIGYHVEYYLALAKKGMGELKSAYNLFSRINIGSDFYADSIINMAEIKNSLNKTEEGLKLIEHALKLKPANIKLKITKARLLRILKRYDESVSLYKKLLSGRINSDNKQYIYLNIADIEYANKNNTKSAIIFLKKAISLNPKNAEAMNYLGYIYIDKNINIHKGIRMVKNALKIYPENNFYQDSLGWGYFKLAKYRKAVKILKKAAKSGDPTILKHLGYVYKKLKKYNAAYRVFLKSYHQKNDKSVYKQLILLKKLMNSSR